MSAISVSFVIPTLNEASLLSRLLESINALSEDDTASVAECIVVDAHSTDNTIGIATGFGCRTIISEPGNISRSRNVGAEQAIGDIVAFIDADCELPKNWLTRVAEQFSEGDVVAVGMTMGLAPHPSWIESTWYQLAHKQLDDEAATEVDWLPSFNIAVKKPVFKTVGGFDETLVTCEDYELGNRLNSSGKLIRLSSTDGVVHHGESKTIPEFFKREGWRARGELILLKKNWSNLKVVVSFLVPLVVVGGLLIAGITKLLVLITGDLSATRLAIIILFGAIPVVLLVLRRRVALKHFVPAFVLLNIYFISRVFGLCRRFQRVERISKRPEI